MKRSSGFTLVELLVVVAVIGVIVAVAIPNLINAVRRSRQSATMATMRAISEAVELYDADFHRYPQVTDGTLEDIAAFVQPTFVRHMPLQDAWNQSMAYSSSGRVYTLVSLAGNGALDLPWSFGITHSTDADIVMVSGTFVQYPDGLQDD